MRKTDRTLKEVLHDTIFTSSIPPKVIAERLNMGYSMLANSANPDLETFHFQLQNLIPLVNETKNSDVLDYIEEACGRVAYNIPPAQHSIAAVQKALLGTIKEFGDLTQAAGEALADNVIIESEKKRIKKEGLALVRQTLTFINTVCR